ncbi:MAG: O-antigen ligase family protein [Anaerolineales bacterium]|nr:O-antigen ligase family protein [Anaerolineales bacterium]
MTSLLPAPAARPPRVWLEWAEWLALLAALGCWLSSSQYSLVMAAGGGFLAVAWLARRARVGQFVVSTPLDLPLLAFLAATLVGLWAAPDGPAALVRVHWFTGAAALCVALAGSRPGVRRWAALGAALAGALLAVYFVTQNPWATAPVKLALINRAGQTLAGFVPDLGAYKPHPNVVASLLALALPVALMPGLASGRAGARGRAQQAVGVFLAAVIATGLVFTESRTALLAVALAGALGIWGRLAARLARGRAWPFGWVFGAPLALGVAAMALALMARPDLTVNLLGSLPGPQSAVSRQVVFGQAWRLAQDVGLTGGGPASFPARYSSYVLDVPVIYLTHAHNAYLNVLVEQGWLGLAGFVGLPAVAAVAGLRRLWRGETPDPALALAGLLGLAVVMAQSLGDATLVASRAAPFWLFPAGLALGGWVGPAARPAAPSPSAARRWRWPALAAGVGVGLLVIWLNRAAWHANLGALTSDRVLLDNFPTGEWRTGREAPALMEAEPEFAQALALDPNNRTAHFYLGLAAMLRRDFAAAVEHLSAAHAADPNHRGAQKLLGYSLVWLGRYPEAAEVLAAIPEAAPEMEVYAWWWGTQGRPDLAEHAAAMLTQLSAGG